MNKPDDEKIVKTRATKIWLVWIAIVCMGLIIAPFIPKMIAAELFWIRKTEDVQNHKQLWNEHRPTKYEISVHFSKDFLSFPGGTTLECAQKLVVDHDTIIETIFNTCSENVSLTVDNLFSIIAEKVTSRRCDPEGCHCGPMVVDVTYDSKYYFPKKAKTYYDHASGHTFKMTENSFCLMIGGNAQQGITLDTYSFKPVP